MEMTITVIGLCLLVPQTSRNRVHVLLPQTSGDHEHTPLLSYDGAPNGKLMNGFAMSLLGGGGGSGSFQWPDAVINVGDVLGKKLDLSGLLKDRAAKLAAWFELPLADDVAPGVTEQFTLVDPSTPTAGAPPKPVSMTNSVVWHVKSVDGTAIAWERRRLDSDATVDQLPERNDKSKFELTISHNPVSEPPKIMPGDPAPHFHMYFHLFFGQDGPDALLAGASDFFLEPSSIHAHHARVAAAVEAAEAPENKDGKEGTSAFSCMVARADAA